MRRGWPDMRNGLMRMSQLSEMIYETVVDADYKTDDDLVDVIDISQSALASLVGSRNVRASSLGGIADSLLMGGRLVHSRRRHSMSKPFNFLLKAFREWHSEDMQVAEVMANGNLLRLRWIVATILPLVVIYIAVFWFAASGDERLRAWNEFIQSALVALVAWWVAIGVAVTVVIRRGRHDAAARTLLFVAPLGSLLFAAAISLIDQLVSTNISIFVMGTIFTSLLIQMRTSTAILIHLVGCSFFLVGMQLVQPDPSARLFNSTDGIAVSLISVLLSAILWRKDARFILLQRQLKAKNDELHRQQEDLKRLATRDPLTGLSNRAELFKAAGAELQRARRRGTSTSAIMLDLDHFKRVNDVHGHQAGDTVLVCVAEVLADSVRGTDLVGRMGGEEFMVVLPDTSLLAALKLADKLRNELRSRAITLPGGLLLNVTASCGVSCVPGDVESNMDWLYASADHALFQAKHLGRDRVEDARGLEELTASDFQRLPKNKAN